MNLVDRRIIPELVTKYKLERGIRDVFVEGKFDKDIVSWFLNRAGLTEVKVFEIDTVNVPVSVVSRYFPTSGQKTRLLSLANELESELGHEAKQFTSIVDIDCDRILGNEISCKLVIPTDYTCMEMYFYDEVTIGKFLTLTLGTSEIDPRKLLRDYAEVLQELFLLRAANETLRLALRWLDFSQYCKRIDGIVNLDRSKFIDQILINSGAVSSRNALVSEVEQLRPRLQSDARHRIHGHDFTSLLSHDLGPQAKRRGLQNQESMIVSLKGCLDFQELGQKQLFQAVTRRASVRGKP